MRTGNSDLDDLIIGEDVAKCQVLDTNTELARVTDLNSILLM